MYDEEEIPNVKRMRVVEKEVSLSQPKTVAVPLEGRGCLVPVPALVSSSPFFFLSKTQKILLALFSHKCGRFVGLEPDLC
jgi:hypothetical protein